jgi:hypothetical protein
LSTRTTLNAGRRPRRADQSALRRAEGGVGDLLAGLLDRLLAAQIGEVHVFGRKAFRLRGRDKIGAAAHPLRQPPGRGLVLGGEDLQAARLAGAVGRLVLLIISGDLLVARPHRIAQLLTPDQREAQDAPLRK